MQSTTGFLQSTTNTKFNIFLQPMLCLLFGNSSNGVTGRIHKIAKTD
jgi:hypothetical protein